MSDVLFQLECDLRSQIDNGDYLVRLLIVDSISPLITPVLGGIGSQESAEEEEEDDIGEVEGGGIGNHEDISSTYELNKRIEEFIRKMKEEILIEAQQLVTVE
ncbi:hypothetical protein QYF36_021537 [Acer negundo]|nr:hypothetical protein QYF36_021537 [Acer negundo]